MRQLLIAVAVVLGFVGCAEAKQPQLAQFYSCKGTDPSGMEYQVFMETAKVEGATLYRQWLGNGHVIVFGQGFYRENRFVAMQWFGGQLDQAAVMEYVIKAGGKTLDGQWNYREDARIFPEVCTAAKQADIPQPVEQSDDAPAIPGTGRV